MKLRTLWLFLVLPLLSITAVLASPTRTVVFMYGQTVTGQDMYLRGGIDSAYSKNTLGRDCSIDKWLCAIPIQHNLRATDAKRLYDKYLDWYGAESGQGTVEGSPLIWTTNNPNNSKKLAVDGVGYDPENTWGDHYWKLDVMMECTRGVRIGSDYWFELKSFISNGPGWEGDIAQTGAPYVSKNHFAKCGYINKFLRGQNGVEFKPVAAMAEFIQTPGAGDTTTEFSFDASRSVNAVSYAWDWENDGVIDVAASANKLVKKIFSQEGAYNVTLLVTGANGATAKTTYPVKVFAAGKAQRTIIYFQKSKVSGEAYYLRGGHDGSLSTQYGGTTEPIWYYDLRQDADVKRADAMLDWAGNSYWAWTTNNSADPNSLSKNGFGYDPENQWGPDYWRWDALMSGALGDFFEVRRIAKTATGDVWEAAINQQATMDTPYYAPDTSKNHWARKGCINVFRDGINMPTAIACPMTVKFGFYGYAPSEPIFRPVGGTLTTELSGSEFVHEYRVDIYGDGSSYLDWGSISNRYRSIQYSRAGVFTPKLEARDPLGKVVIVPGPSVTISNGPSCVLSVDKTQVGPNEVATLQIASDRGVLFHWNNDGTDSASPTRAVSYASPGHYNFSAICLDAQNIMTNSNGVSIDVLDATIVASFAVSPASGTTNTTFNFDASGSTNANEYRWDYEGDGTFDTVWSTSAKTTKRYTVAGNYTAKLEARNKLLKSNVTARTIAVSAAPPLVPKFTCPAAVDVGVSFTCDASATTGATQYCWDFNPTDSTPCDYGYATSLQQISYSYAAVGQKSITLRVRNEANDEVALTQSINVIGAPIARIVANPSQGTAGQTQFTFDASSSSYAASYCWILNNSESCTPDRFATSATRTYMYPHDQAGDAVVTLNVKSATGKIASSNLIVKLSPYPLLAQINVSPSSGGNTGTQYVFSLKNTTNVQDVCWDWTGDGVCETPWLKEWSANKVFETAGSYTIRAWVKDKFGKQVQAYAYTTSAGTPTTDPLAVNVTEQTRPSFTTANGPGPLLPTSSATVGALDGSFEVNSSGAAVYSVPIAVPPGRAGMQPVLSLNYMSHGGDGGVLGVGWSLSGLSKIMRCPKPFDQGGTSAGVRFDDSDSFCLDGARLVAISGNNGADKTEYRTEIESFSKIISYGRVGNGPQYFKVWTKAGQILTFGGDTGFTPRAAMVNGVQDDTRFDWSVDRMEDTVGNYISVAYTRQAATVLPTLISAQTTLRPTVITYTGKGTTAGDRRVEFAYESRSDDRLVFLGGAKRYENQRLSKISTHVATQKVYEYRLSYESTDADGKPSRSRLASITQCAFDDATERCLPATQFTWAKYKRKFATEMASAVTMGSDDGSARFYSLDINGDGKQDFVYHYLLSYYDPTITCSTPGCQSVNKRVWMVSFGSDTGVSQPILAAYDSNDKKYAYAAQPIDYDADGRADLLIPYASGWGVLRYIGTAGCAAPPAQAGTWNYLDGTKCFDYNSNIGFNHSYGYTEAKIADLNADGLQDMVFWHSGEGVFKYRLNSPSGFGATADIAQTQQPTHTNTSAYTVNMIDITHDSFVKGQLFDVNGDGYPDFVWPSKKTVNASNNIPSTSCDRWEALLWTGNGFSAAKALAQAPSSCDPLGVRLADVNGDGLQDLIAKENGIWSLYPNNGNNGFFMTVQITNRTQTVVIPVDLNGDNRIDLVFADSADMFWYPAKQSGIGFDAYINLGFNTYGDGTENEHHIKFMDINGDGVLDLVRRNGVNAFNYRITFGLNEGVESSTNPGLPSKTTPVDMITKITTGLNAETELNYKTLSSSASSLLTSTDTDYNRWNGSLLYYFNSPYTPSGNKVYECQYPRQCLNLPLWVVANHRASNGLGVGKNNYDYQYEDLRADLRGHGFLGFKRMVVKDPTAGALSASTFALESYESTLKLYPVRGQPKESISFVKGKKTALSRTSYGFKLLNNNRTVFPYANNVTSNTYEYTQSNGDTTGANIDVGLISSSVTETAYDDYGNVSSIVVTPASGYTISTTNTYFDTDTAKPYLGNWQLGRLAKSVVTHSRPADTRLIGNYASTVTRVSTFDYDDVTGLLKSETTEPLKSDVPESNNTDPEMTLIKTYARDGYGNITDVTVSGLPGHRVAGRTAKTTYDANGYFKATETNALGQTSTITKVDARFGNALETKDINDLTASARYDAFGRKILETAADGSWVVTTYNSTLEPGTGAQVGIRIDTFASSGAKTQTLHDRLGRVIKKRNWQVSSVSASSTMADWVDSDTRYDGLGRVRGVTQPYYSTMASNQEATTDYDDLGRVISARVPYRDASGNLVYAETKTQYATRETTVTDPRGKLSKSLVNELGQLVKVTDANQKITEYAYDASGNLAYTRDPLGVETKIAHDLRGQKQKMVDASMGTWHYFYDALGQLWQQKDAKSQVTDITYDALGRSVTRVEGFGGSDVTTTQWTYDQGPKAKGQISRVVTTRNNVVEYENIYRYDDLARLWQSIRRVEAQDYLEQPTYDSLSRPIAWNYPVMGSISYKVLLSYDGASGELTKISDSNGVNLWQLNAQDAFSHVTQEVLGNGVVTTRAFDPYRGTLDSIQSGAGGGAGLQSLNYRIDAVGNLAQRKDNKRVQWEDFTYDNLNRLSTQARNGATATSFQYDDVGNITSKPQTGSYSYQAGSHRLVAFSGNTVSYDANGGITDDGIRAISYRVFNKPDRIVRASDNTVLQFKYDDAHNRIVKLNEKDGKKTLYLGAYNKTSYVPAGQSTPVTEHKLYLTVGSRVFAMYSTKEEPNKTQDWKLHYLHTDHQGSVETITDSLGAVIESQSYSAFGQRRDTAWQNPLTNFVSVVKQGYTAQEMDDEVGLINMNGRLYNPEMGRFISADPFVQAPSNAQNLNRYAYVLNNPLSYTDPSGYFFISAFLNGNFSRFMHKYGSQIMQIAMATVLSSAMGPFAAGFITGAFSALASGGDLKSALVGGVIGGFTAVAFSALHYVGPGGAPAGPNSLFTRPGWTALKVALHGAVGGMSSVVQGGSFKAGFLSAGLTQLASNAGVMGDAHPGMSAGEYAGNAIASAVIGGTGSVMGGGKFANGAVTGAFSRLFNDCQTEAKAELEIGIPKTPLQVTADTNGDVGVDIEMYKKMLKVGVDTSSAADGARAEVFSGKAKLPWDAKWNSEFYVDISIKSMIKAWAPIYLVNNAGRGCTGFSAGLKLGVVKVSTDFNVNHNDVDTVLHTSPQRITIGGGSLLDWIRMGFSF